MNIRITSAVLFALIISQAFMCSGPRRLGRTLLPSVAQDVIILANDSLEGRETGTDGEAKAGRYLSDRMQELGLAPYGDDGTYFQRFRFKPHPPVQRHQLGDSVTMGMALVREVTGRNVIGYLDLGASRTVLIGAHYDHLGKGDENSLWTGLPEIHNGADDNASGVACMLEVARRIRLDPGKYSGNNYLFIAFSGEEKGLWGSNYFTKHPTLDSASFNYMINLDMVGRLKPERTLAINGTGTSPSWDAALDRMNRKGLNLVRSESGTGPSDHTSFYHIRVPAVHLFTGQHEDYHKPTDDSHRINYAGISDISEFILGLIRELREENMLVFTPTKEEKKAGAADFKVTLGVMPDYLHSGPGMRIDGIREARPAQLAGLKAGDIVLRIGEYPVTDMVSYMEALGKFSKGETTKVEFERDGVPQTTEVIWD
jgi:hypothetical protein